MTYQFSNTPVYVSEGQTIRFKFQAPSAWDTTLSVTVQIGDQQTIWYITTVPEDFAPDPFPFSTLNDADPDTLYVYGDGTRPGEGPVIEVSGLTPTTKVTMALLSSHSNVDITNFALRIKRVSQGETSFGDWKLPSTSDEVENTDQIQVRLRSNEAAGQPKTLDLAIGSRTERWTIVTDVPPPNVPEPFPDFTELYGLPLNTTVYSEVIQIQGLPDTAIVQTNNGALIGISASNATVTNADGYDILDGVTFVDSSTTPTILNGQFLQLSMVTSTSAGASIENALGIGDETAGSIWGVTTGDLPSETPGAFSFTNVTDAPEDEFVESDIKPTTGISGLGNTAEPSPPFSVPVTLDATTGTDPGVRIYNNGSWSSWGVFPTTVVNGDQIQIRNKASATFNAMISTTIRVGTLQVLPWEVTTNAGPDTDAIFVTPAALTNQVPGTTVASSIISISGINRPITINATNGATISLDFATPVAGPITFDPASNTSIQLYITTPSTGGTGDIGLSESTSTQVTIGTGTTNNPFTWSVTNYASVPPPPELKGCWYSKKTAQIYDWGGGTAVREHKEDGHAIGTVLSVLKSPSDANDADPMNQYGDLKGDATHGRLDARYPGWIDCDGSSYNVSDFPDLFMVIGTNYAKPGDTVTGTEGWDPTANAGAGAFIGTFRVPDYRNRKMVGPGPVDGNRPSSTTLPITTGSIHPNKVYNSTEAGGWGGYWYVDGVDVTAPDPYQQVEGDAGASTGVTSDFFNLGTVRTLFTQEISMDVDFDIVGAVNAQVGPLLDKRVNIPMHSHYYITARTDGNTGDAVIPWGTRSLPHYLPHGHVPFGDFHGRPDLASGETRNPLYFNQPGSTTDDSHANTNSASVADDWINVLAEYVTVTFENEWDDVDNVDSLHSLVEAMIKAASAHGGTDDFREEKVITAKTWWPSPVDVMSTTYFKPLQYGGASQNTGAVGVGYSVANTIATGWGTGDGAVGVPTSQFFGSEYASAGVTAVIDTEQSYARVEPYSPPIIAGSAETGNDSDSNIETHSHYLSMNLLTDPTVDYSYGNVSGQGTKNGLGDATASKQVTFNQSDVDLELNSATFSLVTTMHKPVPNVVFKPNRKVPLTPEFHKTKYIIKAF